MSIVVSKTRLPVTEWQTESGSVVSIANARRRDAKSAVVTLEPIQSGSGDPSPDNIRPISGTSSVTAVRDGKNLLELYLARTSASGVNFSLTNDGKIHLEGTNTSSTSSAFTGGNYSTYEACPWHFKAGTYKFSCTISNNADSIGAVNFLIRKKKDNTQSQYAGKSNAVTVTVDDDFGAWFWISVKKSETVNTDVGVQLETGSTASSFVPFTGTSITVQLGQTVYGGSVDLVSGVGTVTKKTVDLGSLSWERASNPYGALSSTYLFRSPLTEKPKTQFTGILSSYKWVLNYIYFNNTGTAGYIYNTNIAIRDDRYTDKDAFKTAVTGQQLCYELATPIAFQLTPTQLSMLERNNTIWADEGDIEVQYARIHS